MAESASLSQLKQYHRLLLAERQRRNPHSFVDRDAAIEELLEQLAGIAERLRAGPAGIEPTPAQMAQSARDLDTLLAPGFADGRG